MKKFLFLVIVAFLALGVQADEPLNIKQWVTNLKWKSPKRTGISSIDEVYDLSDKLYDSIKAMGDSVPMYSLKSIVENGDTVAIVVVDQFNKPYNSLSATRQIVSGSAYLTSITANAVSLAAKYVSLGANAPSIVKSKGLASIGIMKDLTSNTGKVSKIAKELLPQIKEAYSRRGNPIKAYQQAQASLSADDGFVNTGFDHVPEFDPADMPSDEELDILLNEERNNRSI